MRRYFFFFFMTKKKIIKLIMYFKKLYNMRVYLRLLIITHVNVRKIRETIL